MKLYIEFLCQSLFETSKMALQTIVTLFYILSNSLINTGGLCYTDFWYHSKCMKQVFYCTKGFVPSLQKFGLRLLHNVIIIAYYSVFYVIKTEFVENHSM